MLWKKIRQVVDEGKDKVIRRQVHIKKAFDKFTAKVIPKCFDMDYDEDDDDNDVGRNSKNKNKDTKKNRWKERFQRTRQEEVLGGRIWNERMKGVYVSQLAENDDDDNIEESSLAFVPPNYPKSDADRHMLETSLVGSFIFSRLSRSERDTILSAFEECHVTKGSVIFRLGEKGANLYVIKQGTLRFVGIDERNSPVDHTRSSGAYFGELALLYDRNHSTTCTVISDDCIVWTLERRICRKVIVKHRILYDSEAKKLLKRVYLFKDLDDGYLTLIAHALGTKTYQDGEDIVQKGEDCTSFYIVKKGQIKVTDLVMGESKYNDVLFNPGDSLGERIITENIPIPGNATAVGETTVLYMSRDVFLKLFGRWGQIIRRSVDRKLLNHIPVPGRIHSLPSYEVDALVDSIVEQTFPKGHVFCREGMEVIPTVYFIRTGSVDATASRKSIREQFTGLFEYDESTTESNTAIQTVDDDADNSRSKTIHGGGYFGIDLIKALKEDGETVIAPYTVKAKEDCLVGVLTMSTIRSVVGGRIQHGGAALNIDDYTKHKLLGAGSFGSVYLVTKKESSDNKHPYALKVQNKRVLIKYKMVDGVLLERNIMVRLNHPFIIRLIQSSQDVTNLYILTELYPGGELRTVMESCSYGVPEEAAAFYSGGILEALSFMHVRRTLHRDIKPENVMLDRDGYPVLIDFGFARLVKNGTTYTFCGTPIYLAPEVLAQRGYGRSADLWSWAVVLYEMIVGVTPFYEPDMDQMALFRRIAKAEFEFPPYEGWMTHGSRQLLQQMLQVNPLDRLGQQNPTVEDIKSHYWFTFHGIDFAKLAKKEVEVPWEPEVNDVRIEYYDKKVGRPEVQPEKPQEVTDTTRNEKPLTEKEQELFKDF